MKRLGSHEWAFTHLQFARDGGFLKKLTAGETVDFGPRDLYELVPAGKLETHPISADELRSRSRSDWFVRGLALCQIIWFSIQLLLRAIQHLSLTALEVSVFAFVLCSIVTYGLNWDRPQHVEYPVVIEITDDTHDSKDDTAVLVKTRRGTLEWLIFAITGAIFGAMHCLVWNLTLFQPQKRV